MYIYNRFTLSWWRYLLDMRSGIYSWNYNKPKYGWPGWTKFWCRWRGHSGVTWFNPGGYEPDMTCERCGDDLG